MDLDQFIFASLLDTAFLVALTVFITWRIERYKRKKARVEFVVKYRSNIILSLLQETGKIVYGIYYYKEISKAEYAKSEDKENFKLALSISEKYKRDYEILTQNIFNHYTEMVGKIFLFGNTEMPTILRDIVDIISELRDEIEAGAQGDVDSLFQKYINASASVVSLASKGII